MKFLLLICISFTSLCASAQLQVTAVCPPFEVDIMAGHVNKIYPKSSLGEVQKTFPCLTQVVQRTDSTMCAGVFGKDKGLSFFTDRNYIEVTEAYKGKMKPALMGASRASLFGLLGYPKLKDAGWEAFQMEYGTLVLYYNKAGKVNKLQISSKTTDTMKLCE